MTTMTPAKNPVTGDRLDRIWEALPTADRHVLLGHDNPTLTAVDRMRLAKVVAALGKARREGTPGNRARRTSRGRRR